MGILSDLLGSADTFEAEDTGNRVAGDRVTSRQLRDILREVGDFDYPTGYGSVNEVQAIAKFGGTPSGGTFTLTVTLKSAETFTTAGIAYDANAATIQAAIDTAAASVSGWANGDIVVGGGPLSTTPITLTYSGTSVAAQNHAPVSINAGSVTGGTAGAVTTTTDGQGARTAWAALKVFSIITSSPPAQGDDVTSVTIGSERGSFPFKLNNDTVRALIEEAAFDDNNGQVQTYLLDALGI